MRVCNLHVTCFEIRHALSMPKSYRKIEICCLFTLESQTESSCFGYIVLIRTTTRRNFEVRIFKLCRTIILVERTGVQWVQKTYKVRQNRKGRQVWIPLIYSLAFDSASLPCQIPDLSEQQVTILISRKVV